MLKTIKTTKQMRLDELIKYVWDNGIKDRKFKANDQLFYPFKGGNNVTVNGDGNIYFGALEKNMLSEKDTFTVEIEEPITEDTKLEGVQEVYIDRDDQRIEIESFRGRYSINEILDERDVSTDSLQIYAMINDKKELVWERDGDE